MQANAKRDTSLITCGGYIIQAKGSGFLKNITVCKRVTNGGL